MMRIPMGSKWRHKKSGRLYLVERMVCNALGDVWVDYVQYVQWEPSYRVLSIPKCAKRYGRTVDDFNQSMELIED